MERRKRAVAIAAAGAVAVLVAATLARCSAAGGEPCQYNGQWDPRFYAASIVSGSYARALSKRSKNSSIAFAGTRSPIDSCGR